MTCSSDRSHPICILWAKKTSPFRKKDITESPSRSKRTGRKLLEQIAELNTMYAAMHKDGLPLWMEERSRVARNFFCSDERVVSPVDKAAAVGMKSGNNKRNFIIIWHSQ